MSSQVTVYCYVDLHAVEAIDPFLSLLKSRDHKVVVGHEVDELLLPLSVASPTLVAYAISNDEQLRREPFRTVKTRALEMNVPLLLLGPGPIPEGVVLLLPRAGRYEARKFALEPFVDILPELDKLTDATPEWMKAVEQGEEEPFDDSDSEFEEGDSSLIVDVIEQGPYQLEIETMFVQQGANSHIATLVRREGQLLVREEQSVEPSDTEIRKKMEAQHQIAVSVYASTSLSRERIVVESEKEPGDSDGELSAPIVLSEALESDSVSQTSDQRSWWRRFPRAVRWAAAAGAVVLVLVAVWLMMGTTERDRPPVVTAADVPGSPEHKEEQPPIDAPKAEPSAAAIDANVTPDTGAEPSEDTVQVQFVPVHVGKEMVFAARFRPHTATFWFLNDEAEEVFLKELEPWKEGHTIMVQGFASRDEIESDKGRMAVSRAWAVKRYLIRRGFDGSLLQTEGYRPLRYTDDQNRPNCKQPYCWVLLKVIE